MSVSEMIRVNKPEIDKSKFGLIIYKMADGQIQLALTNQIPLELLFLFKRMVDIQIDQIIEGVLPMRQKLTVHAHVPVPVFPEGDIEQ